MKGPLQSRAGAALAALALVAAAEPAAPGASNELHPSWSPDGKRMVLQSDRSGDGEIWVLGLDDGSAERLTSDPAEDGNPVWSPDGSWIAFHSKRSGSYDLWVVRPDGSGLRQVTRDPVDETSPAWSPDGASLLFEARRAGNFRLEMVRMDGGGRRLVTETTGDHLSPTFFPDGRRILYTWAPPGSDHDRSVGLWVGEPNGGRAHPLVEARGDSNASFSPDGRELVFNSIRDGNWEIYRMGSDGTGQRRLTRDTTDGWTLETKTIDGQPAWSPMGNLVAFTSGRRGDFDIFVMEPDGRSLRSLTAGWHRDP